MRMYDLLLKKRRGFELEPAEIEYFVNGFTKGEIPDYQASAFFMAVCCCGMTESETAALTHYMAVSGDLLDLSRFGDLTVDKHSTGGVGDKTSLVVCPILASLGAKVAKMSGRGLGHTGGTVDKLESIPGYKTSLSIDAFMAQVDKTGLALIGQTGNLAPADKKIYALRDVTATVDSIPLIASSIMSKKIAAGSKNIVLDVKTGSGAFMKTIESSVELAEVMVKIGKACGRNVTAVISDMDSPLGSNIGNSLEVIESVDVLKGKVKGDLYEVCVVLATEMAVLALKMTPDEARKEVIDALESGRAYAKMLEWVTVQGGDVSYIENTGKFPKTKYCREIKADCSGFISSMNSEEIGKSACLLGAGRVTKEDVIDPSAGIVLKKKTGDEVKAGDVIAEIYTNDESALENGEKCFNSAVTIASEKPSARSTVARIIR